ncbi:MAG: shikimate dehydrogenase, partial [Duncaniella sp.]|nr:shikimate dehydrogenase [Duncaniella sp.]
EMDPEAAKIGAVNVIKLIRTKDGDITLKGFNSDAMGFQNSIAPLINDKRRRALILGTGGASKAIHRALVNLGVEPVFVSRNPEEGELGYTDLTPEIMESHKVVVNCTPLGMYPNVDRCPDIPYDLLTPDHLCYDLIYNPDVTTFMKKSRANGAEVKNGLEMLLLQAFESWNIWNL